MISTKLTQLLILTLLIFSVKANDTETELIDGFSVSDREFLNQTAEKFTFNADVSRLLDIIINSLYTNKEVFIRELISNASDACDKIRFMAIQNPEILGDKKECEIHIDYDDQAKTFSITDSGVGMTKAELIKNLGTIAKSGTTAFIEAISTGQQSLNLIGQFGVGFYSTYLVSNKVVVASKNHEDDQHIWISRAGSTFEVIKDPRGNTLGRGSKITLHLKEDSHEFKEHTVIKNNIMRYSEFINFPIFLRYNKTFQREVEEEVEEVVEVSRNDTNTNTTEELEITEEKKEVKKVMKWRNVTDWKWDYERVNDNQPIWIRNKKEVTKEEYEKFYKSITKDQDAPFLYEHGNLEGEVNFKYIFYIPEKRDTALYDNYYSKDSKMRLYVRRVLVSENFEEIIPKYLNFIKGVIDSDDLPLNVSREQLQQHKMIKVMSKKLVRNAINIIFKLAATEDLEDEEEEKKNETENKTEEEKKDEETSNKDKKKYLKFFENFGKNIKLGVIEDSPNRAKLSSLLRFYTTRNVNDLVSFKKYISRMKPNQEFIYYLAGDSKQKIFESPLLQKLVEKEIEVLMLDDPIDEFCIQNIPEYEGKRLKNLAKGDLKLDQEDEEVKNKDKKIKAAYKPLLSWWAKQLGNKIEKVEISKRLTNTAAIVVSSEYGYSAHQEKIQKAQAFTNQGAPKNEGYLYGKKTLEINPNHPSIKELLHRIKNDDTVTSETTEAANLLWETALLNSGYGLNDPNKFINNIDLLLKQALNLDRDAKYEEFEVKIEAPEIKTETTESSETLDLNATDEVKTQTPEIKIEEAEKSDL